MLGRLLVIGWFAGAAGTLNCTCQKLSGTHTDREKGDFVATTWWPKGPDLPFSPVPQDVDLAKMSSELGVELSWDPRGIHTWTRPSGLLEAYKGKLPYRQRGFDPVCRTFDTFRSEREWFRDGLLSQECKTTPRERAMGVVLETYFRNALMSKHAKIHASVWVASARLSTLNKRLRERNASCFTASQHQLDTPCGTILDDGAMALDLEKQSCIEDETFDLVVTQDVFSYVLDAGAAFAEIARTLKPGGALVSTFPLTSKTQPTFETSRKDPATQPRNATQRVTVLATPEVHDNPMGGAPSLVTRQWGYDVKDFIERESGLKTFIMHIDMPCAGIHHAEYREVVVSIKPGVNALWPDLPAAAKAPTACPGLSKCHGKCSKQVAKSLACNPSYIMMGWDRHGYRVLNRNSVKGCTFKSEK